MFDHAHVCWWALLLVANILQELYFCNNRHEQNNTRKVINLTSAIFMLFWSSYRYTYYVLISLKATKLHFFFFFIL